MGRRRELIPACSLCEPGERDRSFVAFRITVAKSLDQPAEESHLASDGEDVVRLLRDWLELTP